MAGDRRGKAAMQGVVGVNIGRVRVFEGGDDFRLRLDPFLAAKRCTKKAPPGGAFQSGEDGARSKRGFKFGERLEQVSDKAVIGDLEDRRFLVLVDGDDDLGVFHAGEVLDRA